MASGNSIATWAPWVRLSNPSVALPHIITGLVVNLEEGRHPWAQVTLQYYLSDAFKPVTQQLPPSLWWGDGTPVSISYGASSATAETFVGYVVSPQIVPSPSSGYVAGQMLTIQYTLLGASYVMQSAQTRTWRRCTASYMAQQIAAQHQLVSSTDPGVRVFDVRQQANESDFKFLAARAAETGMRLTVDGMAVTLTDPRRMLVSSIPTYSQHRVPGVQDTMSAFSASVGETDPLGGIRATHTASVSTALGGVLAVTASAPRVDPVSGVSVAPQVTTAATQYPVRSYADAAAVVQAAATRDLWWVAATATVDGDVRLRPGCVVGVGGNALASQYAGEWMVRTARHRIALHPLGDVYAEYYVDLELGRDQVDGLTTLPYQQRSAVVPALVRDRWVAA